MEHEEMTIHMESLTDEQISEGNNVITNYMKPKRKNHQYHKNWNVLMAVIEKLQNKHLEVWINYKNCQMEWGDEDNSYDKVGVTGDTKIFSVFNATVRFLKWVEEFEIDLDNPVYYD